MTGSVELPPFYARALKTIRGIPAGRVATYEDVARALGKPRAARAVGSAMRSNPEPIVVPCHRVVRSDGSVGSYMGGSEGTKRKIALLRGEGVPVTNDGRIPDLDAVRWRPGKN